MTKFEKILFEKNVTLIEVHKKMGISYTALINFKNGTSNNIRLWALKELAAYLGVSVNDIIEDGGKYKEPDDVQQHVQQHKDDVIDFDLSLKLVC